MRHFIISLSVRGERWRCLHCCRTKWFLINQLWWLTQLFVIIFRICIRLVQKRFVPVHHRGISFCLNRILLKLNITGILSIVLFRRLFKRISRWFKWFPFSTPITNLLEIYQNVLLTLPFSKLHVVVLVWACRIANQIVLILCLLHLFSSLSLVSIAILL